MSERGEMAGAIVLCNHWTQYGIGETFPEGEINGRWYRRNFSTVFGFEQGRAWLEAAPGNRVCHEFDVYAFESLAEEDPAYLASVRKLLDSGRMELLGGTYGQAESQVFGYESAIRQLTYGQAAFQRFLGRACTTYVVEEQSFFPQLPQLLRQAGFAHASVQFQNSGTPDSVPHALIAWEAPDGTTILTVPPHSGMVSCVRQLAADYAQEVAGQADRSAPLIYQWLELWPPGMDWGTSLAPYRAAIEAMEAQGFRQMTLSEYLVWAKDRVEAPKHRFRLDTSNYNNNFFQGGWGYENEKTARSSNQLESLLLTAEALCAGTRPNRLSNAVRERLPGLWSRLLVAQNHDPYLAGSCTAYIDGMRTYMSELAVKQFSTIQQSLRGEFGLDAAIPPDGGALRIFNPCPWPVETPVLLEMADPGWPMHGYLLDDGQGSAKEIPPVFRSDNGYVLAGPAGVRLDAYGTADWELHPAPRPVPAASRLSKLQSYDNANRWRADWTGFEDVVFEPLTGEWKQVPTFFYDPPNPNIEVVHAKIEEAPAETTWSGVSAGMEVAAWRRDLMRIREAAVPAMCVRSLAFGGALGTPFVEFRHRLTGTIRFATGARPDGVWRFRLRVPGKGLRIVADAPFSEEERGASSFYCSRYVRLEWPGRHLLWCPSQNSLFRRIDDGGTALIECTVFDFSYMGTANWGMRIHAARQFSAAESMRLAETYHRRPCVVPRDWGNHLLAGISTDNPNVMVTHAFPSPEKRSVALRVLNASDAPQTAVVRWPASFQRSALAGLDGKPLPEPSWECSGEALRQWSYDFRPWEIATFCISR